MSALFKMTYQAYLNQERQSATKHEFSNGEVFAMTGVSFAHNVIVMNIGASLHRQLKNRPCRVLPSDMRVQVRDGFVYPDVTVVCGKPELFDQDNLRNPLLIVEVLSPSTAEYDASGKFARYRELTSLREYLLVAQDCQHVLHYVRQPENRWLPSEYHDDAVFDLPAVNGRLDLTEVYDKVFDPPGSAR